MLALSRPRPRHPEPGELDIVELKTVDAMIFEFAHAIVNPLAAGLVWRPEDWSGLSIQVEELGRRELRGVRPGFFFDASTRDADASLRVTLPPRLRDRPRPRRRARRRQPRGLPTVPAALPGR